MSFRLATGSWVRRFSRFILYLHVGVGVGMGRSLHQQSWSCVVGCSTVGFHARASLEMYQGVEYFSQLGSEEWFFNLERFLIVNTFSSRVRMFRVCSGLDGFGGVVGLSQLGLSATTGVKSYG